MRGFLKNFGLQNHRPRARYLIGMAGTSAIVWIFLTLIPSAASRPAPFVIDPAQLKDGNLVFVYANTWRSRVVRFLDKAGQGFSHVGMVRIMQDGPHIIHATPERKHITMESVEEFLSPERILMAAVYRIRDAPYIAERASERAWAYLNQKVPFDDDFDLATEERLYCTELIWAAYKYVGVDLVNSEFDRIAYSVGGGTVLLPSKLSKSPYLMRIFGVGTQG